MQVGGIRATRIELLKVSAENGKRNRKAKLFFTSGADMINNPEPNVI
jgi:hypothetical protein